MCNFENILQSSHFSIALDMSRITHFLAEIINPKNSASGNSLTFSMSAPYWPFWGALVAILELADGAPLIQALRHYRR